jgi:diguanylate cyclase (GGDEF)-like protein
MPMNYLKIKEKITSEFKNKYIDNFYKALFLVISIISFVEISIGHVIYLNDGPRYEIWLTVVPAALNFIAFYFSSKANKKLTSTNKKIKTLANFYLFICIVYCFFTIRFDFLVITILAQILILIPFDRKIISSFFTKGIIIIIIYTLYQILMHNLGWLDAYKSEPRIYIFISSIALTIYIAMYVTCIQIQKLIYIISEKTVEAVIDAENANNKLIYDNLTNLFNEIKLKEDIKEIFYKSIAYIDIDDFKKINDTYGHDVGDKTLRKFAEVFSGKHSILYRIHGDEFVILSHLYKDELKKYLELKQSLFTEKCHTDLGFKTTVSIGITDYKNNDIVLKKADALLYNSKKNGKNLITVE